MTLPSATPTSPYSPPPSSESPRLPTLPPELILDIFRDSCFSPSDLAKLALVSRNYFPSAQRHLYRKIIVTHAYPAIGPRSNLHVDGGITVGTFELLDSLRTKPEVANLVKEVEFRLVKDSECRVRENAKISRVESVGTVLNLVRDLEKMAIKFAFTSIEEIRQFLVPRGKKIKHLEVTGTREEDRKFMREHLPSLVSLKTFRNFEYMPGQLDGLSLETLSDFHVISDPEYMPYLSSSRATLRTLEIGVVAARRIIFSAYPLLTTLHVLHGSDPSEGPFGYSNLESILVEISESSAIETLILQGPDQLTSCRVYPDDDLYDRIYVEREVESRETRFEDLSSLKRIELTGEATSTRVSRILAFPMSNLKEFVVQRPSGEGEELDRRKRQMEEVAKMCEARKIELRYAANPPHPPLYYRGIPDFH